MFGTNILKFQLHADEHITSVEGNYTEKSIHRIVFKTNKDQIVSLNCYGVVPSWYQLWLCLRVQDSLRILDWLL
jgi:Jacalin-like lectin domain